MSVHPLAFVCPGARVDPTAEVGPFAYVGPDVVVGPRAVIHHHATVEGHTTLAEGCEVFPNACVGTKTQDLKWRPGTVTGDMVKPGAVVIDVGVNRVPDQTAQRGYRLRGDCDFEGVAEVASALTPVPGGVGPMTIAMLLENTLKAAQRAAGGAS